MATKEWIEDYIMLRGEEVPVKIGYLPQIQLRFFPENPRVYSILSAWDKEPAQDEIEKMLLAREHVKQLIQSIKANGGLTDPIFVRDSSFVVLEGNSRLAAYRALARMDPIKWGNMKCKILPEDIPEDKVFALLGEYHIIGKQDWAPYEQAGYLYRRYKNYGADPHKLAGDLGLSLRKVNHLMAVYSFMINHEDNDHLRWSYYDELLKSSKVKNAREQWPGFDEVVVSKIKSGEIPRAVDVRDNLSKIAKSGSRNIKSFLSGSHSFQDCVERAISGGADEHCYQTAKRFKKFIIDTKVRLDFFETPINLRKKILYEFKKIKAGIDYLEKHLTK